MGVFVFNCPYCGKPIGAQDEWEGKTTMCPHCQKPVVIRHPAPPPGTSPVYGAGMPQVISGDVEYYGPAAVSDYAKNSLWLGIAGICCCWFFSIAAVVLGIMGLNEISHSDGRLEGKGYAWGGICLGILPIIMMILNLLFSTVWSEQSNNLLEKFLMKGSRFEQYEEYNEEPIKPLPAPKPDFNEEKDGDDSPEKSRPIREPQNRRPRKPDELI